MVGTTAFWGLGDFKWGQSKIQHSSSAVGSHVFILKCVRVYWNRVPYDDVWGCLTVCSYNFWLFHNTKVCSHITQC